MIASAPNTLYLTAVHVVGPLTGVDTGAVVGAGVGVGAGLHVAEEPVRRLEALPRQFLLVGLPVLRGQGGGLLQCTA